ncbi:MAG TPA: hypothetical protein VE544_02030 [Nitrososphaeraceae archaeon]|jgi:hypothetical protein|nr:hypothetical protein [Nitrososphaeraceae archaeon]
MLNHFKSKGYGKPEYNDARRRSQARRVREIYEGRVEEGHDFIAIVGDLNDSPDRDPLKPLLVEGSKLTDVPSGFAGTSSEGGPLVGILIVCPVTSSVCQDCD